MEQSILKSTKKILGLGSEYTPFDLDVMTAINSGFSILLDLGLGQPEGFSIEDDTALWADFDVPEHQQHLVKSYIHLHTRLLYDPPQTSYHLESMNKQLEQYVWRLNVKREYDNSITP